MPRGKGVEWAAWDAPGLARVRCVRVGKGCGVWGEKATWERGIHEVDRAGSPHLPIVAAQPDTSS